MASPSTTGDFDEEVHDRKYYADEMKCFIPSCKKFRRDNPNITYLRVPQPLKEVWCKDLRRNCPKGPLYVCDEHINPQEDLANYKMYQTKGVKPKLHKNATLKNIPKTPHDSASKEPKKSSKSVKKTRTYNPPSTPIDHVIETLNNLLKDSKNSIDNKKRTSSHQHASLVKKQKTVTSEESFDTEADSIATMLVPKDTVTLKPSESFDMDHDSHTAEKKFEQQEEKRKDASVQTTQHIVKHISSSKAIKTDFNIQQQSNNTNTTTTTQYNIQQTTTSNNNTTSPSNSVTNSTQTPVENEINDASRILQITVKKIIGRPEFYTGLPVSCCHLLNMIGDQTKIPEHHILLCLKKIRLNNEFQELAEDFAVSLADARDMFLVNIPLIASVMRPFILEQDFRITQRLLPLAFRQKYYNVTCIIDCLEIEVQKTANTNRDYARSERKAVTVKYLISCTPDGIINYVSQGYNGKITDTRLVEACDFLHSFSEGMCVMVGKNFRDIEQYLHPAGVQVVRATDFRNNSCHKPLKSVMRCLRKFAMLKRYECLDTNTVKIIDEIVVIACALVNLRESIRDVKATKKGGPVSIRYFNKWYPSVSYRYVTRYV